MQHKLQFWGVQLPSPTRYIDQTHGCQMLGRCLWATQAICGVGFRGSGAAKHPARYSNATYRRLCGRSETFLQGRHERYGAYSNASISTVLPSIRVLSARSRGNVSVRLPLPRSSAESPGSAALLQRSPHGDRLISGSCLPRGSQTTDLC